MPGGHHHHRSAAEAGVQPTSTAAELILRGSEVRGRRSFNVCLRLMGAFWFIMQLLGGKSASQTGGSQPVR